jgi:sugar O-acyltransferase (sialic acid O-acetyltransferase NeuD family)
MARIVIIGAGDLAKLAHAYFRRDTPHEVVAFAVDAGFPAPDSLDGLPVIDAAGLTTEYPPERYSAFVAIGYSRMNRHRARKYAELKGMGYELVSYVSSRATYLSEHVHGDNCFILEQAVVQPFVTIGNDVVLWSGARICHDSTVGDHCFVAAGAVVLGQVRVGRNCFIGANATIRNGVEVAPATLVGAGAVIMENTRENGVYVPQRSILLEMSSDTVDI